MNIKKFTSIVSTLSLLVFSIAGYFLVPATVNAAALATASDVMSTQATSTTANHTITWTMATGHSFTTGDTIVVDFVDADFSLNAIGSWQTTDFAFNDGTSRTILAVSSVSGTPPTCTSAGANNVCVTINTTTNNFTIFPTSSGFTPSSSAAAVTFTINGTSAAGNGLMTNKVSDVSSSLVTITDTGSNTDSTQLAVAVETNDVVTVTATVNPTLTFAISSASVSLGTITTSAAATGSHTISAATNATGGFAVTYNGATLTSGLNTIAVYSLGASSPGTPGFGMNLKVNTVPVVGAAVTTNAGTCGIATNYNTINSYSFVAGTTTAVTSVSAPADCVYTASYVANIGSTTPAGAYSTALTYVISGTF